MTFLLARSFVFNPMTSSESGCVRDTAARPDVSGFADVETATGSASHPGSGSERVRRAASRPVQLRADGRAAVLEIVKSLFDQAAPRPFSAQMMPSLKHGERRRGRPPRRAVLCSAGKPAVTEGWYLPASGPTWEEGGRQRAWGQEACGPEASSEEMAPLLSEGDTHLGQVRSASAASSLVPRQVSKCFF